MEAVSAAALVVDLAIVSEAALVNSFSRGWDRAGLREAMVRD